MLSQGPSASDAVLTTEAEIDAILATNPTRATQVHRLRLGSWVSLILAAPKASTRTLTTSQRATLLEGLITLDWRVGDMRPRDADSTAPASLPASNGLPSDGLLDALVQRWKAVS